jgi:Family of unknown function (DUF6236)
MIGPDTWPAPKIFLPGDYVRKDLARPRPPFNNPLGLRGVVLLPAWRNSDELQFVRREDDFTLLRKALLYWDVICWPQVQTMDMSRSYAETLNRMTGADAPLEAELDFLRAEGCLIDFHVPLFSIQAAMAGVSPPPLTATDAMKLHVDAYLNLELREPGVWSLTQSTDEFGVPASVAPVSDGALGILTNLLPAPIRGVSYEAIIEFRRRRRAELLALRSGLDELALEIVRSDSSVAYGAGLRRLEAAVLDCWKVCAADKLRCRQATLTLALALAGGAITGVSNAATILPLLGLDHLSPIIAGVIGGGVGTMGASLIKRLVPNPTALPGTCAHLYPYLRAAEDTKIVQGS